VWSGTDSYNAPFSRKPSETAEDPAFHGTDFPVLNLHSHACFLYSATKLLGIEFTEQGVTLKPALPASEYRFASPLLGLARSAEGHYDGWYAPARAGLWTLRIQLPSHDAQRISYAAINGSAVTPKRLSSGEFELLGRSDPEKPLRWILR
jgi:hypothetical protein